MEVIMTPQYKANDGKLFASERECIKYEEQIIKNKEQFSMFSCYDDKCNPIIFPDYMYQLCANQITIDDLTYEQIEKIDELCGMIQYIIIHPYADYSEVVEAIDKIQDISGYQYNAPSEVPEDIDGCKILYYSDIDYTLKDFKECIIKAEMTYEILNTLRISEGLGK